MVKGLLHEGAYLFAASFVALLKGVVFCLQLLQTLLPLSQLQRGKETAAMTSDLKPLDKLAT